MDSCPPLVKERKFHKIINTIKKISVNTSTYPNLEYYEETVCWSKNLGPIAMLYQHSVLSASKQHRSTITCLSVSLPYSLFRAWIVRRFFPPVGIMIHNVVVTSLGLHGSAFGIAIIWQQRYIRPSELTVFESIIKWWQHICKCTFYLTQ